MKLLNPESLLTFSHGHAGRSRVLHRPAETGAAEATAVTASATTNHVCVITFTARNHLNSLSTLALFQPQAENKKTWLRF